MTRLAFTPGEGGGKPAKPESEESQSFSSFYLPYVYTPTPEDDQPAQPPVSPHDFADPPASNDQAVTPTKISIAEQIRIRNQERAEQDAAAQNERQSAIDIAQDIEWSPEDEASGLVSFMQATAQGRVTAAQTRRQRSARLCTRPTPKPSLEA